jgi:hypothetical protein
MYRILSLLFIALAIVAFTSRPLLAGKEMVYEVKVVTVGDGKITVIFKGEDKEYPHDLAKDAKITLDGKKAKLEDLKKGYQAKVTMDDKHLITKIEATSKGK